MLWNKIKRFWKADPIYKDRRYLSLIIMGIILVSTGCSDEMPEVSDIVPTLTYDEPYASDECKYDDVENIAAILRDIYDEAQRAGTLGSLDTTKRMVDRLGENGYTAVDSGNQVDMTRPEDVMEFYESVEEKENDEMTIIVITGLGFRKFDLKTEDGTVNIVRGYYQYETDGQLQARSMASYQADLWQYTEEGYLIYEGRYVSDENFVLTLSDTPEHTMLRVQSLDEKCRELNRKYILPAGYSQNNLFLCNWNEKDYGPLDFYDIFDRFYPMLYRRSVPYTADENLEVGTVYQIPENTFEDVIMKYFKVDSETLRSKTRYVPEHAAYEYRPRGFYEVEYPDIPYPEVISYTENQDGTITLYINAIYPNGNTSKEFSHMTVIRQLDGDSFQYVSNQLLLPEEDYDAGWHSKRLSKEEWEEIYGEN